MEKDPLCVSPSRISKQRLSTISVMHSPAAVSARLARANAAAAAITSNTVQLNGHQNRSSLSLKPLGNISCVMLTVVPVILFDKQRENETALRNGILSVLNSQMGFFYWDGLNLL